MTNQPQRRRRRLSSSSSSSRPRIRITSESQGKVHSQSMRRQTFLAVDFMNAMVMLLIVIDLALSSSTFSLLTTFSSPLVILSHFYVDSFVVPTIPSSHHRFGRRRQASTSTSLDVSWWRLNPSPCFRDGGKSNDSNSHQENDRHHRQLQQPQQGRSRQRNPQQGHRRRQHLSKRRAVGGASTLHHTAIPQISKVDSKSINGRNVDYDSSYNTKEEDKIFQQQQKQQQGESEVERQQRLRRQQRRQEFFQINNITVADLTGPLETTSSSSSLSSAGVSSSTTTTSSSNSNTSIRDVLHEIIHTNRQKLIQNQFAVLSGLGLAFNSGYINGCCLSGVLGQSGAVAAFTGSYTLAGLAIGAKSYHTVTSILKLIGSFALGSTVFGFINPTPIPGRLSTRYGPAFLIGSILMALSALTANIAPHQRTFLYLAAMANGLQNAATSAYSQNLVRTSHMSGITSDMGLILGQMLRGNMSNAWRFLTLVGLSSSFLLGGVVSFPAVTKFKSMALVFNSVLYCIIAISVIWFTAQQKQTTVWKVATGQRSSSSISTTTTPVRTTTISSALWRRPIGFRTLRTSNKQAVLADQNDHEKSTFLRRRRGRRQPIDNPTKAELELLISQYGTTVNGRTHAGMLTESDFASIILNSGVKGASRARLRHVFERIDSDHNGLLSADELLDVLLTKEHLLKCDGDEQDEDDNEDRTSSTTVGGDCTLLDPMDDDLDVFQ